MASRSTVTPDKLRGRWAPGGAGVVVVLGAVLLGGCLADFSTPPGTVPDAGGECGNGIAEVGESCDGTDLAGQSCTSLGQGYGILTCQTNCLGYVIGECGPATCGNWVLDANEQCDGTDFGGETCVTLGLVGGELACALNCESRDTSGCELRPTGNSCDEDYQCTGQLCFREGPTGYSQGFCTSDCVTGECAADEVCVTPPGALSSNCHPGCVDPQDCRAGYACFDYYDQGAAFCFPHCRSEDDCPFADICNRWTGLCEATPTTGLSNGDACTQADECLGPWCLPVGAGGDGYCASACALSDGICPGSDVCVQADASRMDDLGLCVAACTDVGDCAAGLSCADAFSTGSTVCWP